MNDSYFEKEILAIDNQESESLSRYYVITKDKFLFHYPTILIHYFQNKCVYTTGSVANVGQGMEVRSILSMNSAVKKNQNTDGPTDRGTDPDIKSCLFATNSRPPSSLLRVWSINNVALWYFVDVYLLIKSGMWIISCW